MRLRAAFDPLRSSLRPVKRQILCYLRMAINITKAPYKDIVAAGMLQKTVRENCVQYKIGFLSRYIAPDGFIIDVTGYLPLGKLSKTATECAPHTRPTRSAKNNDVA
jgi:hypothetical protein